MTTTPAHVRCLLSDRFRWTPEAAAKLAPRQREAFAEYTARVADGRYRLAPTDCPCGHRGDAVVAERDRYGLPLTTVLCLGCGTARFDPYLDSPSLEDFYRRLYQDLYARALDPAEYFERQRGYGRKVMAAVFGGRPLGGRPAAVLEVGCGAGGGLSEFHAAGLFVAGCDYSDRLIEYGTGRGVPNLHVGSAEQVAPRLGRDRFDLIFLHHVFEHVDEPAALLRGLARLLAPGGRLLIIVPDLGGIHTHTNPGGDALGYIHVAHKFNYSTAGFERIAAQVGLTARRVRPPRMPTAWSVAPELWVEVPAPGAAPPPPAVAPVGRAVLRYLRRTEWCYQRGLCPVQLAEALWRRPRRYVSGVVRRFDRLRAGTRQS